MKTTITTLLFIVLSITTINKSIAQKTLSLEEAIGLISQGNRALQIQQLEELRVKASTKEAKSKLMPNIALNASAADFYDRQVIFLPGSFAGTNKPVQEISVGGLYQYNANVSLFQPLVSQSANKSIKASLIDEKIEAERTRDLESNLVNEVTKSYYQILLMQNQLVLFGKSLSRNEKAFQDSKSLLSQGKGLKSDTLISYITVENLKASISYQRSAIVISKTQLKLLLGINEADFIELVDDLCFEETDDETNVLKEDLQIEALDREDIAIQKLKIQQEDYRLSATKALRLPELSLIGQFQLQSQSDDFKLNNSTWHKTSFLGLQMSVSVFNGGKTSSKIKQNQIQLEEEKLKLNELYDTVKVEIAILASNWDNAKLQYETQKRTVEAAEINYTMNLNRYSNGLGSKLEVTDAELALTASQFNYLQSIYNLKVNAVELQRAMGYLKL
jgi:outer membrane protein TolC